MKRKRFSPEQIIKILKALALFEAKTGDLNISRAGKYFANKLGIPFYQIVYDLETPEEYPGDCFNLPASSFLTLIG